MSNQPDMILGSKFFMKEYQSQVIEQLCKPTEIMRAMLYPRIHRYQDGKVYFSAACDPASWNAYYGSTELDIDNITQEISPVYEPIANNTQSDRDARGSATERFEAASAIRTYESALKASIGGNQFYAMRATIYWPLREAFKSLPYTQWVERHRLAWDRMLAGKIRITGTSQITGKRADFIVIDESSSLKETAPVKPIKQPKKTYNTCAVRFMRGSSLDKVYTYRVPKKVKLHLGEEIVVPSLYDNYTSNSIAVVVELHSTPQDTGPYDYKFITGRITRVKA